MINLKEFLNLNFYVSKLDQFLTEFDKKHPNLSASQRKEMEKFERIYKLRDDAKASDVKPDTFWKNF